MIQRIQTLFLLVAAGLIFSLFLTPMINFTDGVTSIKYIEYYPSLIMTLVTFVLSVVAIVSYKKRLFQIRICNLNTLILLGFQIFIAVKFFTRDEAMMFSVTAVFPIVAAILTFIAMRYIARDEAMVMAASRLRGKKSRKM